MTNNYDVIVIGAGPAGYVAAIRCAQLGMTVACIDDWLGPDGKPALGGTCLNAGCIPSKSLLESSQLYARLQQDAQAHGITVDAVSLDVDAMMASKDATVQDLTHGIAALFDTHAIAWISGRGLLFPDRKVQVTLHSGEQQTLSAGHVILATGSVPVELPVARLDGDTIVDSAGALNWRQVPQRLGIIGAGVCGLELGGVWRRAGAVVVLLDALDVLLPRADRELAKSALNLIRLQ
mgnify:CR=1 FL=1